MFLPAGAPSLQTVVGASLQPGSLPVSLALTAVLHSALQLPSSSWSQEAWQAPGSSSVHHCLFLLCPQTSEACLVA